MTATDRRNEILEFIGSKSLMSISSISSQGQPQAAVVGFGETDDFRLVFGTSNTSRKYQNLQRNKAVAVVIGWDDTRTVQYEGVARELAKDEAEQYAELYFAKNPHARKYKDLPDQRYFMLTPTWIRYTNLASKPWDIIELQF